MIDTIFFDNWNTLVKAPSLMKQGSSTRMFHRFLTEAGLDIPYDDFMPVYREVARRQRAEADADNYREIDYRHRFAMVLGELGVDGNEGERLASRAWGDYLAEWLRQTEFFDETPAVLDSLKGEYKLGVITNYMDGPTCRRVFDKLGFDSIFDSLVVSAEVGYRKPAKVIFDEALKDIQSAPASSLMVGDSLDADIVGARNASMRSIFIDLERDKQEHYHLADAVIHGIGEFPRALAGLS
jgi:putative hydrolase of the HAD superfamily